MLCALTGVVGAVGSAAAAGGPGDATHAPDKTIGPTTSAAAAPGAADPAAAPVPSVPPLPTSPSPTMAAPPTSAWIPTTTIPSAPTVAPASTASPSAVPVTAGPAAGFDGIAFLTEVYTAVNGDPLNLLEIAEERTILNSPANLFIAHLVGVTITDQVHGGPVTPQYTVAASGKGVSVCDDMGMCDTFGDFDAPTGLLETFTVNGTAIEDSFGLSRREVVVESLSIDSVLCFSESNGTLSCVALLTSTGAATALSWEQAVFTTLDGRQFVPDLTLSAFGSSVADGDFGSAHVVFPGSPREGELTVPVVSGISGSPSVVSVPVRAL